MDDADDLVPPKWRSLFNNADWLIHDIVVKSIYGFFVIALIAHALVFAWRGWLPPQQPL
ncbi:MAG: light-harvesting protein [Chloroflexaceae bacterium]|nr:light-harvesting protein [Chloroflexaceae bacterium]NJL33771.1 light-harvesting protein [Chloroflexaceae bacterium]NJO06115.1 light-harvesting protein [Chloroflexaceae bacterium]